MIQQLCLHHLTVGVSYIDKLREMSTESGVPMSKFMGRAIAQALAPYRDKGAVPQAPDAPKRKQRQ
jgi:hypothetical protein